MTYTDLLDGVEWRKRMGIEPTAVAPLASRAIATGFEVQEAHQRLTHFPAEMSLRMSAKKSTKRASLLSSAILLLSFEFCFASYPFVLANGSMLGNSKGMGEEASEFLEKEKTGTPPRKPSDATRDYILGRIYSLKGSTEETIALYQKLIEAQPKEKVLYIQFAKELFKMGDLFEAKRYIDVALELDSKDVEARLLLANIYSLTDQLERAEIEFKKILAIDPNQGEALLFYANLLAEKGKYKEALVRFDQLLKIMPDSHLAYYYKGQISIFLGSKREAEANLKKAIELRPSFVSAILILGRWYEEEGEIEKAISLYRESFSKDEALTPVASSLVNLLIRQDRYEEALQFLEILSKQDPENLNILAKTALINLELSRFGRAIEQLKLILAKEPEAHKIRFFLGAALEEMKRYEEAIAVFSEIPRNSKYYLQTRRHISLLHRELKNYDAALHFLEGTLLEFPEDANLYQIGSLIWEERGDLPKAIEFIQNGIERVPSDEELRYNLGMLYDRSGKKEEALVEMQKILEINPNNGYALNYIGYSYAEKGENLAQAERLIRKAHSQYPEDGYILDSLAWVYYRQGKYEKALQMVKQASEKIEDEPIVWEHFGDIYRKLKKFGNARKMYEKALALGQKKKDETQISLIQKKIVDILSQIEEEKRKPAGEK